MPDVVAGKVPIIACVRSSWAFLGRNLRLLAPAAAICAALSQIGTAALLLFTPAGQATPINLLTVLPALLAGLMFSAAVLRKAVRDEFVPPVGLVLGGDEGRLFAVGVSVTLVALPVLFLLAVVFVAPVLARVATTPEAMEALADNPEAMTKALEQALGPGGMAALEGGGALLFCIALGLIALFQAATIGEKRILLFQALRWTSGNLFRVLAAIVLTIAPTVIIGMVAGLAAAPLAVDVLTYLLLTTLLTFIGNILAIPVSALGAVLYKGLRPPDFKAK